jgi:glyoxylase-like metal-dependent hydrolase (beta-lactamase superfamily II)
LENWGVTIFDCDLGVSVIDSRRLEEGWFDVSEVEPDVFRIDEPLHSEWVKSYLVVGRERAALIDTGCGVGNIRNVVDRLTSLPVLVINSHAHWDHVGGNYLFTDIAIHEAEAADLERGISRERMLENLAPDQLHGPLPWGVDPNDAAIPGTKAMTILKGGEVFDLGGVKLEVIHAPGHSPGGIVLFDRDRGILFSTDVAYAAPLYCYSTGTNFADYRRSMRLLAEMAPEIRVVYGAHNETPFPPEMLISMDKAFDAVAAGEVEPEVEDGLNHFTFDGFSLLLPR